MFHQIKKSLHMLHRQITSTVTLTLLIALLGNTTTGKNVKHIARVAGKESIIMKI